MSLSCIRERVSMFRSHLELSSRDRVKDVGRPMDQVFAGEHVVLQCGSGNEQRTFPCEFDEIKWGNGST